MNTRTRLQRLRRRTRTALRLGRLRARPVRPSRVHPRPHAPRPTFTLPDAPSMIERLADSLSREGYTVKGLVACTSSTGSSSNITKASPEPAATGPLRIVQFELPLHDNEGVLFTFDTITRAIRRLFEKEPGLSIAPRLGLWRSPEGDAYLDLNLLTEIWTTNPERLLPLLDALRVELRQTELVVRVLDARHVHHLRARTRKPS